MKSVKYAKRYHGGSDVFYFIKKDFMIVNSYFFVMLLLGVCDHSDYGHITGDVNS
jgi:hypothetical protein